MRTANPMHTTKGTPRQPICRGHCRDGRPCPNHACYGWSVCRMHGAGTPRGQASPHYVDGRYSKELPSRLRERYDQAASDPDLLVLRSDISLLDVRLGELVASLDSVGAPARLATIQRAAGAYRDAMGTDKEDPALAHLLSTIDAGTVDDDATWETIMASLEQRRKLVESERKRLVELGQMVTAEQLLVLLDRTVAIIQRHVSDRTALAGISREMHLLAHVPARGGVSGEGE